MDHHPVQFIIKWYPVLFGIFAYAVDANVDVTLKESRPGAVIESDRIGVGFMLQVSDVNIEEVFVCAKDKIEFADCDVFLSCHEFYPLRGLAWVRKGEIGLLAKEPDPRARHQELM